MSQKKQTEPELSWSSPFTRCGGVWNYDDLPEYLKAQFDMGPEPTEEQLAAREWAMRELDEAPEPELPVQVSKPKR